MRAALAVFVAAAIHITAVLVADRAELTDDTLSTIIWIVLGVWGLALIVLLLAAIGSGRGVFLLGGEAWRRIGLAAVAALAGGFAGMWLGEQLQEWTGRFNQICLAIGQPIPFNCPSEWLYTWTPFLVTAAVAGLAWTLAASRR